MSATAYEGTAFTYGVGGLLGDLEELSPGLGMVIAPIELADFFGNAYITKDATGTSSGWEWRVTGSEKIGSTNMWKVTASHRDVRDFCLGYATMTMWLDADSPWAARQTVDVAISSSEASQTSCSACSNGASMRSCPRVSSNCTTPLSEPPVPWHQSHRTR